jgi:hypothetical protein
MRRPLTWLGLAVGALAFWRWSLRRRKPAPGPPPSGDPAEELKRKLAESRAEESTGAPEPEPASAEPQESLDERRRAVHDKARQTIDDMLGGENLPGEESD